MYDELCKGLCLDISGLWSLICLFPVCPLQLIFHRFVCVCVFIHCFSHLSLTSCHDWTPGMNLTCRHIRQTDPGRVTNLIQSEARYCICASVYACYGEWMWRDNVRSGMYVKHTSAEHTHTHTHRPLLKVTVTRAHLGFLTAQVQVFVSTAAGAQCPLVALCHSICLPCDMC